MRASPHGQQKDRGSVCVRVCVSVCVETGVGLEGVQEQIIRPAISWTAKEVKAAQAFLS